MFSKLEKLCYFLSWMYYKWEMDFITIEKCMYTVVIYLQFSDSYGIIYADKQVCYATIYSLDGQCCLGATS